MDNISSNEKNIIDNIIDVDNLVFSYNNKDIILDNINFKIKQGELVAVVGPNGCGKSTLVKQFNGLLVPNFGSVTACGYLTTDREHILDIRKNIAMVFQNPDNQIVLTVVEEDVAFALENLGFPPDEIKMRVEDALKIVDMIEYKKYSTHRLSGGQKQKIAIASALAMMPKCIVFDESTSMLDPIGRKGILDLMIKLSKQHNIAVIFVTHFMDEACLADRLIVMNQGKIITDDRPINVLKNIKELVEIGLELPEIAKLCKALRDNDFDIDIQTNIEDVANYLESVLFKA